MRAIGLLSLILVPSLAAGAATVPDGRDIIQAMHDRYVESWPHSAAWEADLSIVGAPNQTRRYALLAPGRMRVDVDAGFADVTVLFRGDSVYQWINGQARGGRPFPNEGLLLAHGVYTQPVATTIAKLESWGFDLNATWETEWQGRRTWVVGADEGDTTSNQFWVDQELLYLVRVIHPDHDQGSIVSDTRLAEHVSTGGGWVATKLTTYANGQLAVDQVVRDFRPGAELPDEIMDPELLRPAG